MVHNAKTCLHEITILGIVIGYADDWDMEDDFLISFRDVTLSPEGKKVFPSLAKATILDFVLDYESGEVTVELDDDSEAGFIEVTPLWSSLFK